MRPLIAALALLLSASPAFSQKKPASNTQQISLRTLSLGNAKLPELWTTSTGKPQPLAFSNTQPSVPLKADKTNPFKIFKSAPDEKGKPTDPEPYQVDLSAASSFLLVGWIEEEKPSFVAIEDPFATMKKEDWLIVNRSKKAISVKLGEAGEPHTVEAASHLAVKCTAPGGEGLASTVSAKQDDGTLKPVFSSYLPVYADKRGLIVIYQAGERIRVDYIADQLDTAKPVKKKR